MLTVSYRDVGMDCDYVCKGETEEEVMKNGAEHAMKDHGLKEEEVMKNGAEHAMKDHGLKEEEDITSEMKQKIRD